MSDLAEVFRRQVSKQEEQVCLARTTTIAIHTGILSQVEKDTKMIERFRCGAESRSTDEWRVASLCRISGVTRKTFEPITDCLGKGWYRYIMYMHTYK